MYQFLSSSEINSDIEGTDASLKSKLNNADVAHFLFMKWNEHCVECSAPDCFKSCPLYSKRKDGECQRFESGIVPVKNPSTLCGYAANIQYKRWGKLEAELNIRTFKFSTQWLYSCYQSIYRLLHSLEEFVIFSLFKKSPKYYYYFFRSAHYKRRLKQVSQVLINKICAPKEKEYIKDNYDCLYLEIDLREEKDTPFSLEFYSGGKTTFKQRLELKPGMNVFEVSSKHFVFQDLTNPNLIRLYPQDPNATPNIQVITAEMIKLKSKKGSIKHEELHAKKVKCVVWDLDNVLWKGILAHGDKPVLIHEAVDLIRKLDSMGVIQSIASKNNFEGAWEAVKGFGLEEYFLYPEINWGPKSESLKRISKKLNIGINALAFIDDSEFERAEVESAVPNVRTYNPLKGYLSILENEEFKIKVSEEAKNRRLQYKTEMKREEALVEFSDNYKDFVKDCQIQINLFKPGSKEEIERCWELLSRTNQFNLTGKTYTIEEFILKLKNPKDLSYAIKATDKYGSYGTVGYCSFDISTTSHLKLNNFVMSCRVANRFVENAIFSYFPKLLRVESSSSLEIPFVLTGRNAPLHQFLESLPAKKSNISDTELIYTWDLKESIPDSDMVRVD